MLEKFNFNRQCYANACKQHVLETFTGFIPMHGLSFVSCVRAHNKANRGISLAGVLVL